MATTLDLLLPVATPQATAIPPISEIQALSNFNLLPENPDLGALQLPGLAASATDLPSIDQLLNPDLPAPELPTVDVDLSLLDPTPLPVLDPATFESWFLDAPPDSSPDPSPTELDPSPTELDPPWTVFTDWLEPHMFWQPLPTFLMPAEILRFQILDGDPAGENEELSDPLPTAMPESMLEPTSPEIIGAGSAVDRSYDWVFFDQGDITINGDLLSPKDGGLTKWLPGGTTYVALSNDGLMIGPHLIPYPEEYRQWMQEHNFVFWK